ncbi:hypothetical protein ACOCG7_34030 (plasmid) [Paraburkholderia sp. DD10]|uniref:hypothetical protein n=1 Tax=Paraburkholderia sp. DD10 TaxID=3409691 RepID=UPI003BA2F550
MSKPLNRTTQILAAVSQRLFLALVTFLAILLAIAWFQQDSEAVVPALVIASGVIGGFVTIQRRLKDLTIDDLELLESSWLQICLSPLVGGILALLLYIIFLGGLLTGSMFPTFVQDGPKDAARFASIFAQHASTYQDYAKLFVWSFLAGYSEHFVTDVLGRFEGESVSKSSARQENNSEGQIHQETSEIIEMRPGASPVDASEKGVG